MKRWRLVSIATVAVALAAVLGGLMTLRARAGRTAPVAAAARIPLQSCKPVAPVLVKLEPGPTPGVWQVHLDAVEDAKDVAVVVGSSRGDIETASLVVWRGSLRQGAKQDVAARFPVTDDATSVWADARVASAPGVTQRGLAALSVLHGKVVAQTTSSSAGGRVVTDPRSGETVVEFQGKMAGKP